jgi:hypothetical protein
MTTAKADYLADLKDGQTIFSFCMLQTEQYMTENKR